ncbi:alpha/beta fold hydrolase [Sphingomonas fennica]|uniref:alpha/beta fold hydrolase n=1 Tax=Edaphosphingomonas fennica TaxID=114404 RepID=UPI001FE58419|nr:alpha/beta fold hydrolase [Sphingomonas fennica]
MTSKTRATMGSHPDRRNFLEIAVASIAASPFVLASRAEAQAGQAGTVQAVAARSGSGAGASLGPLRQIDAGALNVGYVDSGPTDGPAVILLHGWPYDIHAFAEVIPLLASAGCRVIVPHLRGYGTTRFLSTGAVRNGQQAVVAVDIIALMDALGIETAILAGFDWGARTANVIAALWPERCKAMVSVSGYLIGSQVANRAPLLRPPNCNGGINSISPPNAAGSAMKRTGMISPSSSGRLRRQSGALMMPRSSDPLRHLRTLTM